MITVKADYPNLSYKQVIQQILDPSHHNIVSPRGKKTFEVQPFIHEIRLPYNKLCSVPGRKANSFFNMAENMWILGGHGDSEWICSFNNKLAEFQLDEGQNDFNAPYGRRIRFYNKHREKRIKVNNYIEYDLSKTPIIDQLHHCYMSLIEDNDSRQAVVSLWNPVFDNHIHKTKDRPCNTTIYFKIRNKHLNMTVCNRSNDVHLGLYGVNFVQFGHLQEFMAAALKIDIGQYIHISDSLHIYEDSQHTHNIIQSGYDFDIYEHVSTRLLTHVDIFSKEEMEDYKLGKVATKNLGDFLILADQVISESQYVRKQISEIISSGNELELDIDIDNYKFMYCANDYSKACFMYLLAYDLFKKKLYPQAFKAIDYVFNEGEFHDWAILGLEFMMRNKEFNDFMHGPGKFSSELLGEFLIRCFLTNEKSIKAVRKYCEQH